MDVEIRCAEVGIQGVLSKPISREQIKAIWRRYGHGESVSVEGLKLLPHPMQKSVAAKDRVS